MIKIVELTKEDLLARRAAIVERFGLDERGFAPIEAWRDLDFHEYCAKDDLLGIDWLLEDFDDD